MTDTTQEQAGSAERLRREAHEDHARCCKRGRDSGVCDTRQSTDALADALAEKEREVARHIYERAGFTPEWKRLREENADLLKRAEAAERLHDEHCAERYEIRSGAISPIPCTPPWRRNP